MSAASKQVMRKWGQRAFQFERRMPSKNVHLFAQIENLSYEILFSIVVACLSNCNLPIIRVGSSEEYLVTTRYFTFNSHPCRFIVFRMRKLCFYMRSLHVWHWKILCGLHFKSIKFTECFCQIFTVGILSSVESGIFQGKSECQLHEWEMK